MCPEVTVGIVLNPRVVESWDFSTKTHVASVVLLRSQYFTKYLNFKTTETGQ